MKDLARDAISGLPEYIPGKQVEEVVREFKLKEVVKLASNENPLGPSPRAAEAVKNQSGSLQIYPDQHHLPLREALAEKLSIAKESLIVGNGSDEIMLLIAQTFLSAGDEVVISKNTFSMYEFVTKIMEGTPVLADLKEYTYDLESVLNSVTDRTKLVFLCNPNNPTGTIFTAGQFDDFMAKVPDNLIVVIDEAYGDFADSKEYPSSLSHLRKGRNLIVLRTFSKIYGLAALRIGYGISTPTIIKYLNLAKMPFNVNRLAQVAALEALKDEDFLLRTLKNNSEGKKYLYAELENLGLKFLKTQANFIFIDLEMESDGIFMELMRQGVIVRPLKSFGLPRAIRVTVGTMSQNEKFIKAIKKVLAR